jgi:O-acetyl-ADP-ribose deacetylase (regulator of RNase III)
VYNTNRAIGRINLFMEETDRIGYNCSEPLRRKEHHMPKETEEARDERKRTFIEALKESKCRALVEPLHRKTAAYLEGKIPAEDLFKTIHYVSKESGELITMFKKRPDVILAGIAMEENLYVTEICDINVKVRKGDLTVLFVDAIVNPANTGGSMGGGVAGAIKLTGGDVIEKQARAAAPIALGSAVATEAGDLPNLFVIHAPTVDKPAGSSSPERVKAAVSAALTEAERVEAQTIAIPGMGTGVGEVPFEEAARAVVEGICTHETKGISDIILIDRDEKMAEAFVEALERHDGEND